MSSVPSLAASKNNLVIAPLYIGIFVNTLPVPISSGVKPNSPINCTQSIRHLANLFFF